MSKEKFVDATLYGCIGGLFGAIILAMLLFGTGILSIKSQTIIASEHWWREWIGALSGWAAAVGAMAVGLPTLKFLREQIKMSAIESQLQQNFEIQREILTLADWMREQIRNESIPEKATKKSEDLTKDIYVEIHNMCQRAPSAVGNRIRRVLPITTSWLEAMKFAGDGDLKAKFDETETRVICEFLLRDLLRRLLNLDDAINKECQQLSDWKRSQLLK